MIEHSTKPADAAAVISTVSAATTWLADAVPVIQFISGIIAIVTGVFAIVYYYKQIKNLPPTP